jgi:hypothetical protein
VSGGANCAGLVAEVVIVVVVTGNWQFSCIVVVVVKTKEKAQNSMYVFTISFTYSQQKRKQWPLICQIDWKRGCRQLPGPSFCPAIIIVS